MLRHRHRGSFGRLLRGFGLAVVGTIFPLGCSDILEVTDPDIILKADSPAGAIALKNGVVLRLAQATNGIQGPDAIFVLGGLLADEWRSGDTFVQRNNLDQRLFEPTNTFHNTVFRAVNRVRVEGAAAIRALRAFVPDSVHLMGQMFAYIAYAEVLLGEHYCNGTPLSNIEEGNLDFGQPITNDSVFRRALATSDSAVAAVTGVTTPAAQAVVSLASVVRGRALANLGQFSSAATAVAAVPVTFRSDVTHSLLTTTSQIWALNNSAKRYTMVDVEGGTGLDFVSANDPRLPRSIGPDAVFDASAPIQVIRQGIYAQFGPVPIANGIEAKLIVAENLLSGGNPASTAWLDTLNALRTNTTLYPAVQAGFTRGPNLGNLVDPGTPAARVAMFFRERAFWLFSTGHRLGDLRRLVRQYGVAAQTIFPTGAYYKGGAYGDAVNMPVPFQETNNPNFTQCIDVNP
jgi:starch-binding outer membrane protein, SusD/RagB family